MDDIALNLLALAGFALIGSLIFYLVRRKNAADAQAILQLAAEKGWKLETIREPLLWGQRFTSPRWTLESVSRASGKESGPGSSDVFMLTVWQAYIPGATILIGERQSQANLGAFGEMLMRQVLQQALGADADGLTEIKAGSEAFQQKYMLWAQKPEEVRITSSIEAALLSWKGNKPLIRRTSEGMSIEQRGLQIKTRPEFEQIINLGEMLSKIL
jgi:LPXTG-motif cell wall-anchored protein